MYYTFLQSDFLGELGASFLRPLMYLLQGSWPSNVHLIMSRCTSMLIYSSLTEAFPSMTAGLEKGQNVWLISVGCVTGPQMRTLRRDPNCIDVAMLRTRPFKSLMCKFDLGDIDE